MIENILKNSLIYTNGKIKVSTYSLENKVLIAIKNKRQRISEELIDKVKTLDISHVTTYQFSVDKYTVHLEDTLRY